MTCSGDGPSAARLQGRLPGLTAAYGNEQRALLLLADGKAGEGIEILQALGGNGSSVSRDAVRIAAAARLAGLGDRDAALSLLSADDADLAAARALVGRRRLPGAVTTAQAGVSLVVSVDCGIASIAEAEAARDAGLELIVTDHHEMKMGLDGPMLPRAAALVHPRLPCPEPYPFGGLSGAGVAFKLAWAVAQRACGSERVPPEFRELLMDCVGLAALGLVVALRARRPVR